MTFNPKNVVSTVKQGIGGMMLWGCFAASGTDELKNVNKIMKEDTLEVVDCTKETSVCGEYHIWGSKVS